MKTNGSVAHGQDPKPRIMVVDDEPANLQVIRMVVVREKFPCDLILFENGQAGLDYLNDHRVDLILLDVVMPGMNGFEMFAKMRENPEWAEIPVIFLSAIQEPEYIIRGLEMGASDYVGKPIISQVLTGTKARGKYSRFEQDRGGQACTPSHFLFDTGIARRVRGGPATDHLG